MTGDGTSSPVDDAPRDDVPLDDTPLDAAVAVSRP